MSTDVLPAINVLEKRLAEAVQKANEIRSAINMLCESSGLEIRYKDIGKNPDTASSSAYLKADTFYGKKLQTATREYLAMRKAGGGDAPAKPREIYDALIAGGYEFDTKDAETALIGLRALLRKRYETFHKLPNGTYGLTSWYPDAKKPKGGAGKIDNNDADEDEDEAESA